MQHNQDLGRVICEHSFGEEKKLISVNVDKNTMNDVHSRHREIPHGGGSRFVFEETYILVFSSSRPCSEVLTKDRQIRTTIPRTTMMRTTREGHD